MITKTFASIAVMSVLGLFLPIQGYAFGLGKLELSSALNEPFKAEIVITALRETDAGNVQVQLASNKEFERAGLERSYFLTQFTFEVIESSSQTKVVISSKLAVKEPLLDFLISATTGNGRLIREYIVLLDPPKNIFRQVEEISFPSKSIAGEKKSQIKTTEYHYPDPYSSSNNATSYGPTDQFDTLWRIASNTRPETSVSVQQMMIALVAENPTAFIDNNINGLKAGYTLSIPSIDVINQLPKKQARNVAREQNNEWRNRNTKTVKIVGQAPVADTVPTKIEPTQEQENITTGNVVTDENADTTPRLTLIAPDNELRAGESDLSPLGDATSSELNEQLTFSQAMIEQYGQENIDINSRMEVMEEQIQTLRRLISLKDADLSRLQNLLEEKAQDESPAKLTDDPLDLLQDENNEQQELSAETVAEDEMEILDSEIVEKFAAPTNLSLLGDAMTPHAVELSSSVGNEILSAIDEIKKFVTENKKQAMLAGLLLLILWLIIRRIKRSGKSWEDAVENLDNIDPGTTITSSEYRVENTLSDVEDDAKKTVKELIDDADVYVNYDYLTKAKRVLEVAHNKEPSHELVIQKLLFVLYKQQQIDEFIGLVEQSELDKESSAWQEIVDWGRKLAPDHDLFKQEAFSDVVTELTSDGIEPPIVSTLELASSELEFNEDGEQTRELGSGDEEHNDLSSFNLDIDSGNQTEDTLKTVSVESDNSAFDTPLSSESEMGVNEVSFDDAPLRDTNTAEASITLENVDEIYESELIVATQALSGDDEVDFDLEIEMKLDFASAYVDIGNVGSAKTILEEVISDGDDEQKTRAQALLDKVS